MTAEESTCRFHICPRCGCGDIERVPDVDPINRIAGTGAWAHGGEERGEGRAPFGTHLDAPIPVVTPVIVARRLAALDHGQPRAIFLGPCSVGRVAMRAGSSRQHLARHASAGLRGPVPERVEIHNPRGARTRRPRLHSGAGPGSAWGHDQPPTKALPDRGRPHAEPLRLPRATGSPVVAGTPSPSAHGAVTPLDGTGHRARSFAASRAASSACCQFQRACTCRKVWKSASCSAGEIRRISTSGSLSLLG
jgi:hypothetical protein